MPALRALVPFDVPVDPDAPEARRLLLEELEKAKYGVAPEPEPTWFDDWLRSVREWFSGLFDGVGNVDNPVWLVVLVIVIVAALVVAFLLFGVPRLNRRSKAGGELFAEDDERDAAALRDAAKRAAAVGDYALAIGELFRALARVLTERTLVITHPGTTAHGFARRATAVFPDAGGRLAKAADDFDGVRYLGHPGTVEQWEALVALERELRTATPERGREPAEVLW